MSFHDKYGKPSRERIHYNHPFLWQLPTELLHSNMAKQARPKSSADRDPGVNADWRWLIAGGVAGSVAKTCTAPLSRVTILLQVKGIDLPNGASSGASLRNRIPLETLPALRALVREEGFASLWRGNGTSVVHRFPYSAINFWTFETAKRWLVLARSGRSEGEGSERLRPKATPGDRFIAGAIAAATAVTLCYPLDLVRTRLAAQSPEDKSKYRGMFHALSRIWRHGGFLVGFRDVVDLLLNSWHPSNKLPFPCRMSRVLTLLPLLSLFSCIVIPCHTILCHTMNEFDTAWFVPGSSNLTRPSTGSLQRAPCHTSVSGAITGSELLRIRDGKGKMDGMGRRERGT